MVNFGLDVTQTEGGVEPGEELQKYNKYVEKLVLILSPNFL